MIDPYLQCSVRIGTYLKIHFNGFSLKWLFAFCQTFLADLQRGREHFYKVILRMVKLRKHSHFMMNDWSIRNESNHFEKSLSSRHSCIYRVFIILFKAQIEKFYIFLNILQQVKTLLVSVVKSWEMNKQFQNAKEKKERNEPVNSWKIYNKCY